ncbi:MAG: 3-phosphoshikimate 1-carboxyvinyltransferase, partial [Actinobacteria bacterium]|nr:3-phosphoshikimate 1-carboxyvinyltransferase [Actinomycetota bacterium]
MSAVVGSSARPLTGVRRVPGDKSISHRVAILGAMAPGTTVVSGFSPAGDCRASVRALEQLGVKIEQEGDVARIEGAGPSRLRPPDRPIDCERSATTMRLLGGVLAGAAFPATLTGDPQLLARPMGRLAEPLRSMGAGVELAEGDHGPVTVRGGPLTGFDYRLPVASAQVKSAVLLAGLQAEGTTTVVEALPSRDHTERLLEAMGAPIQRSRPNGEVRTVVRRGSLSPIALDVPGDLSSAAPLVAAAAIVPGSDMVIRGVGLNPTRAGFLRVLRRMGADIEVDVRSDRPEPVGDLRVRSGSLTGTIVDAEEVPATIDELPLIGLLGAVAEGETVVRGAEELRLKESDRITGLVAGLRAMGADVEELPGGFVVNGPTRLRGGACDAREDHRLAMAFAVAGLISTAPVHVTGLRYT